MAIDALVNRQSDYCTTGLNLWLGVKGVMPCKGILVPVWRVTFVP